LEAERERERERGVGLVWRRRGSGPAAARAGGALPRDSGERRGRRDAGRRGRQVGRGTMGARSSVAGCGVGQRGEAVVAVLTCGVGSTVRPIRFSNRIKFILNGFKFAKI
jgi:hypothetical protein